MWLATIVVQLHCVQFRRDGKLSNPNLHLLTLDDDSELHVAHLCLTIWQTGKHSIDGTNG